MSPTSYQTAPPRILILAQRLGCVKLQLQGSAFFGAWIADFGPFDFGKWRQRVRLGLGRGQDLLHLDSMHQQRVGDQGTMAPPGDRFGAHDRRGRSGR